MKKLLLAIVCALASVPTFAATLDQEHESGSYLGYAVINPEQVYAQTFTVGLEGSLSSVDLRLSRQSDTPSLGFTVGIYSTTATGKPDTALFDQAYSKSSLPVYNTGSESDDIPFTSFDVSSASIALSVGDVLAIVVSRDGIGGSPLSEWVNFWGGREGTPPLAYQSDDGGSTWVDMWPDENFTFRTYVSAVPIPAAAWLFLSALGGLVIVKRKRS